MSEMNAYCVYKGINAFQLQTHIRNFIKEFGNKESFEVRIENINAEFTLTKNTYKTKPSTLSILIRTGDVGRKEIHFLHKWLESGDYQIKVKRSPKRKYISQIRVELCLEHVA